MSARERILARVRRAPGGLVEHPGRYAPPTPQESGFARFAEALAAAGGRAHGPHPPAEAARAAAQLASERAGSGRVLAAQEVAPALGPGPWRPVPEGLRPQAFADVAVAVLAGRVGVAESGAVAVALSGEGERALAFLARHVLLLLAAEAVEPELGAAFARLPAETLAGGTLTWIAGPSKTADIELALVKGAHGPLTLDVVGVAGEDDR